MSMHPTSIVAISVSALALATLAPTGCGGSQPPAAAPASSASSAASVASAEPQGPCLPTSVKDATLAHVEPTTAGLLVCYGGRDQANIPCLTVDPGTGQPSASSTWTRPAGEPGKHRGVYAAPSDRKTTYTVASTAADLTVCKANTAECRKVKPEYAAQAGVGFAEDYKTKDADKSKSLTRQYHAAASDDGKRLFVLDVEPVKPGDRANWNVYGDTFDIDSGKRAAHVPLIGNGGTSNSLTDPGALWQLVWLGDRVWMASFDAKDTTSEQELLDPVGGSLLDLGAPSFFVPEGGLWVAGLAGTNGDLVKLVEPKSLSNVAKVTLPSSTIAADPTRGLLRAVRRPDGKVWVAYANPPGTVVIDTSSVDSTQPVTLPICKQ